MINPKLLTFLRAIKKNNTKIWYDEHKAEYKQLRLEFATLIEHIRDELAKTDPVLRRAIKQNKKTYKLFRIHRDTRFSHNKQKYKTNIAGVIAADVKDLTEPAYYLSIEPGGKSFIGGGVHAPDSQHLGTIRDLLERKYKKLDMIVADTKLQTIYPSGISTAGSLKTAPRGYDIHHPGIQYVRRKNFTIGRPLTDAEMKDKNFTKRVTADLEALVPFNQFLRQAK